MTIEAILIQAGSDVDTVLKRFGDNKALLERFMKKFISDENFHQLEKAVADKDYKAIEMTAHTLKGLAANLGFTALSNQCAEIVADIRESKFDRLDSLMEKASEEYKKIIDLIEQLN